MPPPPPPPYREAPSPGPEPGIHPTMVTVTEGLPGYRVVRALGIVHGVAMQHVAVPTVSPDTDDTDDAEATPSRRRHAVLADMIDAHQRARKEALAYMIRFAAEMGANAVIGVRYDTAKLSETQTEFLAYGTAAWAEPLP